MEPMRRIGELSFLFFWGGGVCMTCVMRHFCFGLVSLQGSCQGKKVVLFFFTCIDVPQVKREDFFAFFILSTFFMNSLLFLSSHFVLLCSFITFSSLCYRETRK